MKRGLKRTTMMLPRAERPPAVMRRVPTFPDAVNLTCRVRAGQGDARDAACEACGAPLGPLGGEVRPRLAYDAGACPPAVFSGPANGVLLCGSVFPLAGCRARAWAMDPEMEARGFRIRPGTGLANDPRHVPVVLGGGGARGGTVWLSPDGSYLSEPLVPDG